ncbi:MAG TPA: cytochrome c [Rhodocyclaceae bacterium]
MIARRLLLAALLLGAFAAHAAEDARTLVQMPPEARAGLRAEMLDFQTALHQVIAALAAGKGAEAAETAERHIGLSAMGRHRAAPANARPGMYMPDDMHMIARNMHAAASNFAAVARGGDLVKSLGALEAVTGACVGCHRSYRTQ